MAVMQVRPRIEGDDINTTDKIVLYRPIAQIDGNGNAHVTIEQLLFWKAGAVSDTDPNDPRKQSIPGAPDEWIFILGGPVSRPYDGTLMLPMDYDAAPSPGFQDVSFAYYTAYAAHAAYIQSIMYQNPEYAAQRNALWFTQNPLSNDEAFVETPLAPEAVPPIDYGGS